MSYLTTPQGTLQAQVAAALESEGFPYEPLHMSWGQYLASALGQPNAWLYKSHAQMLSEIDAQYGGSLSHLRVSIAQILDDVAANIGAGGGGGEPYVAKAVHFDGATYLSTSSLTAPGDNTGYCSLVYRFKFDFAAYDSAPPFWVEDPTGGYTSNSFLSSVNSNFGLIANQFCDATDTNCWEANGNGDADNSHAIAIDGNWHQLAVAVKTNLDTGSKIFQSLLDGVPLTITTSERGTGPFLLTFNGLPFFAFSDGYGQCIAGDISDWWFAPGQFVDWSNPANMAKVRDPITGKPVNLGANGELVTGIAPAIFFSGDATGFATNKGTGGAFSLTGALTNASTSPSD